MWRLGQFQNAEFVGVSENQGNDGDAETYLSLGVTLSFKINAYLAAEAAYYFDRLGSDVDFREYDRNRVFVGVRATY